MSSWTSGIDLCSEQNIFHKQDINAIMQKDGEAST